MDPIRGQNVDFWLRLEEGGQPRAPRTHAELELERAVRALFYAMEGKNKSMRNVAEGVTHPVRMLVRRFRDAKRARRHAVNYPLAKQAVRALDDYVDALFQMRVNAVREQRHDLEQLLDGDYPKAA